MSNQPHIKKEDALSLINQGHFIGNYKDLCDDPELMERAILVSAQKKYPCPFYAGGTTVKNTQNLVLLALHYDRQALKYCSEELKNNKEFVLKALDISNCLEYASLSLKDDSDVLKKSILKYPSEFSLFYASERLKNNKEIVLLSVERNGNTLQYASNALKEDFDVVLKAVSENAYSLRFAHKKFKSHYEIVLASLTYTQYNPQLLKIRLDFKHIDSDFLLKNPELIGIGILNSFSPAGFSEEVQSYLDNLKRNLPDKKGTYYAVAQYLITLKDKKTLSEAIAPLQKESPVLNKL